MIESGRGTRTYLVLDKPPRYTRTGIGVLWHPRSQTRPESYRIYLVWYNIRRRGNKIGTIASNGNRQDMRNATNVDKKFKTIAGWESRNTECMLTIVIGESAEGVELVPQHGKFDLEIWAMLPWKKGSNFGFDLGLLVKKGSYSRIQGGVMGWTGGGS